MSTLSRVIFDPDTTPPAVPSNVVGTPISSSRIDLAWAASSDNPGGSGVAGYLVFRNGTQIATASTTAYSDTGLAAATTYSYRLAAVDVAGNISSQSTAIPVTTLPSVSTFQPLQQYFADNLALVNNAIVVSGGTGGNAQLNMWRGNTVGSQKYGTNIDTTLHLPSRSSSFRIGIQAGTSGFPSDGETPAINGLWGFEMAPPASMGARNYGRQGDTFHFALKVFITAATNMATTSLSDGAQKFILYASPSSVTGKNDVHFCGSATNPGFAFINEYDPNEGANNTYPDDRAPSTANAACPRDRWACLERVTTFSSNGATALDRMLVDDIVVLEFSGPTIKWRDTSGNYHTRNVSDVGKPSLPNASAAMELILFMTYWNNHPDVDTFINFDGMTTAIEGVSTLIGVDNFGNRIIGSANIV